MTAVAVREATPDELHRVISVQVMAFSADPIMRWLYPDAESYLLHFRSFATAFGGLAFEHSTAFVASDFGGAAMWLPPEIHADGEAVGSLIHATVESPARDEALAVLEEMDGYHIDEPHWYLPMIGVDPARQGKGIGAALLQTALARTDDAGLPAFLESSNPANVPLYERHGFKVLGTIQIGSSPPVFPMLRDAR